MMIDWFTVTAQASNFLILVWLLKRFLYGPILQAIDQREKRIAAQLQDADAKKREAQQQCDDLKRRDEESARRRDALLHQAADEAKAERQRLMDEARQQADALRATMQEALRHEQHRLGHDLASRTQQEVFALTRKALAELASSSLEERMIEVFIRRLREFKSEEKGKLALLLRNLHRPALVRSAFELPGDQRGAIQRAVKETFRTEIQIQFETWPALASGIELTMNGYKLAWSIGDYLVSLEKSADEILEANHAAGQ